MGFMGHNHVVLDDAIEIPFRLAAIKKFGPKRGSLEKAFSEAITDWTKKSNKPVK